MCIGIRFQTFYVDLDFVGRGVDFDSGGVNITVTPPTTTTCHTINITDDSIREGDETFSVVVSSPDDPVDLRTSTAVVTIRDDDGIFYGYSVTVVTVVLM